MASVLALGSKPRHLNFRRVPGFTLVELLVVLAILGIALSLVGPFTINQLDKVKRAQEREEIRLLLNEWQFRAFNQRRAIELGFSGRQLLVSRGSAINRPQVELESQIASYEFAFSQFPSQSIIVNAHGYANYDQLQLLQGEREFTLNIVNTGLITGSKPNAKAGFGASVNATD